MRALRVVVVAALCVAAAAACTSAGDAPDPVGAPPAAAAESSAAPGPAVPFDLKVEHISLDGMDNAEIRGVAAAPVADGPAAQAVAGAREALAAFLDAQLVAEDTRFSAGPVDRLLSARALGVVSDADRAGLGQVPLPVARTRTGPASARAHVLVIGDQVDAVTLTYDARLTVVLEDDAKGPGRQWGSITFVPTDEGWRADAVEVRTELPEAAS